MFFRVQELFQGGGELLKAEAEMAARRMRRAAITSAVIALAVLIVLTGLGVLIAGGTAALARETGWPAALAITGGTVFAIGLVVFVAARPATLPSEAPGEPDMNPSDKAAEAKEQIRAALDPDTTPPPADPDQPPDLAQLRDAAIAYVVKNPAAVASGALLALSVIGPGRAFRLVTRGAALAGLASTIMQQIKDQPKADQAAKPHPPMPRDDDIDTDRMPDQAAHAHMWKDPVPPSRDNPMGIGVDRPPGPQHTDNARAPVVTPPSLGRSTPGIAGI